MERILHQCYFGQEMIRPKLPFGFDLCVGNCATSVTLKLFITFRNDYMTRIIGTSHSLVRLKDMIRLKDMAGNLLLLFCGSSNFVFRVTLKRFQNQRIIQ